MAREFFFSPPHIFPFFLVFAKYQVDIDFENSKTPNDTPSVTLNDGLFFFLILPVSIKLNYNGYQHEFDFVHHTVFVLKAFPHESTCCVSCPDVLNVSLLF